MFRQSARAPVISVNTSAIEQRLRAIESRLGRMGRDAGRQASSTLSDVSDQIGDTITAALNEVLEQLRGRRAIDGWRSHKLGNVALDGLSDRVESHPLATVAIALGIGFLIGLAGGADPLWNIFRKVDAGFPPENATVNEEIERFPIQSNRQALSAGRARFSVGKCDFNRDVFYAVTRRSRGRALRPKNRAWLAMAETVEGSNGLAIRKAGSGRSPVGNAPGRR